MPRKHPPARDPGLRNAGSPVAQRQTASGGAPASPRWMLLVAIAGTLVAIALRVLAFRTIGPLWRDEVGSAGTATASTFAEFLARQPYDSLPLFWQLLLRGWTTLIWDGSDLSIRSFGLLVSLLLLPALWWACRSLAVLPLASLLFAGVAPVFVVWAGIQNRAYGLAVVLVALLIATIWRLVVSPNATRFAVAVIVAVIAVHTSYQNPIVLAALIGAAVVIGIRRRSPAIVVATIGVGIVAAATLFVNLGILLRLRELAKMVWARATLPSIAKGVYSAIAEGGVFVVAAFAILVLAACAWGVRAVLAPPSNTETGDDGDATAFAASSAIFAVIGQTAFLLYMSLSVQPWYYGTVILVCAVAVDVVWQRGIASARARAAIGAVVTVLLLSSAIVSASAVNRRQTNIDLIAGYLEANARPGDLIVVYPWHYGLTFNRYYHGSVPFMTIPDVEQHEYHRFDQLARLMLDPELIKPGFRRIYQTLMSGNGVWVVGRPTAEVPDQFPILPPPRDEDPSSWRDGFYTAVAGLQLSWVLQQASPQATVIPPLTDARVQDLEAASLTLYSKTPR